MTVSANDLNNIFLKNYMSQIKSDNTKQTDSNNSSILKDDKVIQKMAFEIMLNEMMDSTQNPMMKEYLMTALSQDESTNPDDLMNTLSKFNCTVRSGNFSNLLKNCGQTVNEQNGELELLGLKASKYESNLNPGAISNTPGDYGGKSYGAWQFSARTGSLNSFVNSLQTRSPQLYSILSHAKAQDGNRFGKNFDDAWSKIAASNKNEFLKLQQNYVKETYYDRVAEILKSKFNFDINQKSNALKESLWSTVVQHGVGGSTSIFSKLNLKNTDYNIINDLYNERQKVNIYFKSSSQRVRQSVYNRFNREKQDMLNMLETKFA